MGPTVLTGQDLELSAPVEADLDAITRACQDPEVAAWTTVPSPYARADAEGFLTHVVQPGWARGTDLTWAVRGRPTGAETLLGMIGLNGVADGSAEIGYWLAPWARGAGVMQRAVELVVDHAFAPDGPGLVRVTWSAYVGNWPSRRLAWRAGFRVEGTVRLHGLQRGARRDSWVGTLLRGDPRRPNEPWPDEAPSDGRAVPGAAPAVQVR